MGSFCTSASAGQKPESVPSSTIAAPPQQSKAAFKNPYPKDYDPPFPIDIVGTFSNHGIEPDRNDYEVVVKTNQDRGSVDFPFAGDPHQGLFCCLDGHGSEGDKVSEYCIHQLHDLIADDIRLITDPAAVLKEVCVTVDDKLRGADINSHSSGTSAVVVYLRDKELVIANVGDSRGVMGVKRGSGHVAKDLTVDQKPDDKGEKQRILSLGGRVTPPDEPGLSARVWTKSGGYGLSMSRSLGDHLLSSVGVIAEPEITRRTLSDDDEFMILATDGIWEFITSEEAVKIVSKHTNATEACYDLIHTATSLWRKEEGDYRDDITAVVLFMRDLQKYMRSHQLPDDLLSPTSKDLRKRRQNRFEEVESPTAASMATTSSRATQKHIAPSSANSEKAKTFRRRRLSLGPMDTAAIEEASKAHELATEAESAGGPRKVKRRISISPDMDPGGKALVPEGLEGRK